MNWVWLTEKKAMGGLGPVKKNTLGRWIGSRKKIIGAGLGPIILFMSEPGHCRYLPK